MEEDSCIDNGVVTYSFLLAKVASHQKDPSILALATFIHGLWVQNPYKVEASSPIHVFH